MSILTAVSTKVLHLPVIRFRKGPKIRLGKHFCDAISGHSRAISGSYMVAMGLDPDTATTRERARRKLDY